MVDKDLELLRFIKEKKIWRIILQPKFPEEYYKAMKKEYFSGFLKNKIGIPRDPEIAKTALDYLLKQHYFKSRDHLDSSLQTPFLSKNIFNREIYLQKFEIGESKDDLDVHLIEKQELKKLDESREEPVKEITQEINQEPMENPIISVPDQQQNVTKPQVVLESRERESRFDPWWKKLGLSSNPFPDTDGVGTIKESLYEQIIVVTEIFEKYIHYTNEVPSELFKNIIFYGEFGSGKTTLFEYLHIPLVKNNIHPAIIRLPAEPDYQSFLMKFKQKLLRELVDIFGRLTGTDIASSIEPLSVDDAIAKVIKSIEGTARCNGFVIFLDDIYKPQGYERVSLKFLNHLQTFTAEIKKQMALPNIGFFISAPLQWESILKDKQEYSGSVTWEERMPIPTEEEARRMFNERLAAFAVTREKCGYIQQEYARQVCSTLKSRGAFTFRNFIKECLRRFEDGDFGILVANPVSINDATLKSILQQLRMNLTISDGIDELLNLPMSPTDKAECFRLLVEIFLQRNVNKDSDLIQRKFSHFKALANARLITESNTSDKSNWSISKELMNFNALIYNKLGFSLDDYFLRLFENKLPLNIKKHASEKMESTLIEKLVSQLRSRSDRTSSSIRFTLETTSKHHKQIVSEIDRTSNPVSFKRFKDDCRAAIKSLSDAVAIHADFPANGIEFWNDYWYYPDSLDNFLKVLEAQSSALEPNNIYLYTAYENAFTDILRFLSDQIEKNETLAIPSTGLKNEEISEFQKARDEYRMAAHTSVARRVSSLVENKLREFIYSVFCLQYGDSRQRLNRIPIDLHPTIIEHRNKDKERGLKPSKNELTYLNRQHYWEILVARDGIGYENWTNTFSKIFTGWDVVKLRSYVGFYFYHLNLISAHNKEVFTTKDQSQIYQYVIDSIWLVVMINRSYITFLERVKKAKLSGSTQIEYYFTLDENKYSVQPVHVSDENRNRIISLLKGSVNSMDLSSPCSLEQRYGIDYRELFAILADLLSGSTYEAEAKVIKKNDPVIVLRVKS